MNKYLFIFLIGFSFLSCKNDTGNPDKTVNNPVSSTGPTFEMLPEAILKKMWNEAEMLDYIFHDLPFSMSQNEKSNEVELKVSLDEKLINDLKTMSDNSRKSIDHIVAVAIKRFRSSHADYMGINLDYP